MWILKKDSQKAKAYASKFWELTSYEFDEKTDLLKGLKKELQATRSYKYLNKNKINEYLCAEPQDLLRLHTELFTHILKGTTDKVFSQTEWEEHQKDHTHHPEYSVIDGNEIDTIKSIFNYGAQIGGKRELSYFIAKLIDSNTCTYCNRQYTLTVFSDDNKPIIRPEFDHWFSQQDYPDLALSFFNLIPSCSLCNSSLKRAKKTSLHEYIHPYVDSEPGFAFGYKSLGKGKDGKEEYSVDIDITTTGTDIIRVQNTLDLFRIEEIYNAHANYELRDLIELATAYPGDYIEVIIGKILKDTSLSKEEIFRMLFGIEMTPEKYQNRPFSKFKNDIINQIHEVLIKEP